VGGKRVFNRISRKLKRRKCSREGLTCHTGVKEGLEPVTAEVLRFLFFFNDECSTMADVHLTIK
jgi:hypothetical protein